MQVKCHWCGKLFNRKGNEKFCDTCANPETRPPAPKMYASQKHYDTSKESNIRDVGTPGAKWWRCEGVTKTCAYCEAEFKTTDNRRKYCSKECAHEVEKSRSRESWLSYSKRKREEEMAKKKEVKEKIESTPAQSIEVENAEEKLEKFDSLRHSLSPSEYVGWLKGMTLFSLVVETNYEKAKVFMDELAGCDD